MREFGGGIEGTRGWLVVIKGEFHQLFKFKLRIQVRGAGLRNFIIIINNSDVWYIGWLCTVNSLNFCVSGIFPETAWRVTNHRQATHAFLCVLGSWKRNRLAAHSRPPGDARRLNQLLGWLVKPPGGAGQSDSFWVFLAF